MKVLASDFDGTIYFKDGFHQEDIDAIKAFQKAGHLFGLCSGRPYEGAKTYGEGKIEFDFFICATGALIVDKNEKILYEECISYDEMKAVYDEYSSSFSLCIQADGTIYRLEGESNMPIHQKMIESLEDIKDSHIYGLSINANTEDNAKKVAEDINNNYPGLSAFQNIEYIDVVKKGCSKGHAITMMKDILKLDSIAGIGDSFNDVPMLENADDAFTFNRSPELVKSKANHLVDSVAEAIAILMK